MSERAGEPTARVSKRVKSSKPDGDLPRKDSARTKVKGSKTGRSPSVTGKTRPVKTGRHKRGPKGGSGKKKKIEQQQLEPITPFNRGISIAVKLGAVSALVVAGFMIFQGYLTASIASQQMDAQINSQGVAMATALEKAIDPSLWWVRDIKVDVTVDGADGKSVTKEVWVEPPEREKLIQTWNARLKDLVESQDLIVAAVLVEYEPDKPNEQSFVASYPVGGVAISQEKIGGDAEQGLLIFEGETPSGLVRRYDKRIDLRQDKQQEIAQILAQLNDHVIDDDEKAISEAVAKLQELTGETLEDPKEWQQWGYDNPAPRPSELWEANRKKPPWVSVFVNAASLEELQASLRSRILWVTGFGVVGGVFLIAMIAWVLTGPLRQITGDVEQIAAGDLAHQSHVTSSDEVGALAHVFNIMVRNLGVAQSNAVAQKSFERELNIAKEIQEKLLPERIPQIPGIDIHSHYNSAKEVGGDYYDFIVIDQTHLGIIVADVAGKGVPGAMVMTMARSLVRLASVRNVSPADTFKKVNRILAKDIRRGMFVTAAYMVLNVKTRVLKVASAGHNPVVLYRAKTGENELIKPKGIALGFDKGTIFDNHIQEVEVQLHPGDRIVTYTDGVNEAMNNASEEFGDDRFYSLVREHARKPSDQFVQAIVKALDDHRGDAEQSDDITITTLAVTESA
ncbi:MAG: SpoIIE family protein phosphatase [Planctomycetota bacterium]